MRTKSIIKLILALVIIVIVLSVVSVLIWFSSKSKEHYYSEDFGITDIKSDTDFDGDGVDDYTDITEGAKMFLERKPPYKSVYYEGGYPTDEYAVCTDVVWAAMKNAGYSLKDAVDKDISENPEVYFDESEQPDPNIDFRRVRNLRKYFTRTAESLTLDTKKIEEWKPGDIVTFKPSHIAVVSDRRNKDGVPYILEQTVSSIKETDLLTFYEIDGHFRITGDYKYAT